MFDSIFISVMAFLGVSLVIFSCLEITNHGQGNSHNSAIIFVLLSFFLISITVTSIYSPDFLPYRAWFISQEKLAFSDFMLHKKDPAFFVLSKIISKLGGEFIWLHGLFLAIILVSLFKILTHKLFGNYAFLSLLILFCMFYIIHEVIQIRIAVAIALGMLSFLFLYDDKKIFCLLFFLLSVSFHLAGIFLLVPIACYYLASLLRFTVGVLIALLLACIILLYLQIEYQSFVNYLPDMLLKRSKKYLLGNYPIKPVEIFTTYNLVKLSFIVLFLLFYKNMDRIARTTALVAAFNFVIFLIFKNNDSIALRYTQYFSLFDILLYVSVLRSFSIYAHHYKNIRLLALAVFSVGGLIWLRATMRILLGDFI